jgi:hypothetical protein
MNHQVLSQQGMFVKGKTFPFFDRKKIRRNSVKIINEICKVEAVKIFFSKMHSHTNFKRAKAKRETFDLIILLRFSS